MPDICSACFHAPENHRPGGCVVMEIEQVNFRVHCDCTQPIIVAVDELYPAAVFDADDNFQGHRTVGSHRAWCFEDREWCYPFDSCSCCTRRT